MLERVIDLYTLYTLDNAVTVKKHIEKNKVMGRVTSVISLSSHIQNRPEKLQMLVDLLYLNRIIITCGKRSK
jgi:hypothetical protein